MFVWRKLSNMPDYSMAIPACKPNPEPLLVERSAGESAKLFAQNHFTDCVGEGVLLVGGHMIRHSSFPVVYSTVAQR